MKIFPEYESYMYDLMPSHGIDAMRMKLQCYVRVFGQDGNWYLVEVRNEYQISKSSLHYPERMFREQNNCYAAFIKTCHITQKLYKVTSENQQYVKLDPDQTHEQDRVAKMFLPPK